MIDIQEVVDKFTPLKGPNKTAVAEIISKARSLSPLEAELLEAAWKPSVTKAEFLLYMQECTLVMAALRSTERGLPACWIERLFYDIPHIVNTKALDAIADAISATIVMDLIPRVTYDTMTSAWREISGATSS